MAPKEHGTCTQPLQKNLRWGVDWATADKICCYNRHFAEYSSYFMMTDFMKELEVSRREDRKDPITFYDPINSKPIFIAPKGWKKYSELDIWMNFSGRSWKEFIRESTDHGWPSFRDEEVVWDNVRCLRNGECVTLDGIHLGHNLPDGSGNRFQASKVHSMTPHFNFALFFVSQFKILHQFSLCCWSTAKIKTKSVWK